MTVTTWAQLGGVAEDVCRMLGRWSPSLDEGYMRAVHIEGASSGQASYTDDHSTVHLFLEPPEGQKI